MSVIGAQVGAAPRTVTVAIEQDPLPAGASDLFYIEPAGPAQFEPDRDADRVLVTGGNESVTFDVAFEGAYYGVSAWRHLSDGSVEAWSVPPVRDLPYQARFHQRTRYYTTLETYVHPLTAGQVFAEHELGHEWREDFTQGLRFWCVEYGSVNHNIHRMVNDPAIVQVPQVTYYGVEDTELPVPEGWIDEVFHEEDYTYDYTYPAHTLAVPASGGVGGRVYHGRHLDWDGDGATMKAIGAGMVPVLGLKMDSDWEMERRIFTWDDPFDVWDFDPAGTHLVVFMSETWYVLELGALPPDNAWHTQRVRYDAASKTFDVWVDDELVQQRWFPNGYGKPPPSLPAKTWLYISSNVVESYRFRGRMPYYCSLDSQEFRLWPGCGETFGLLWGAESFWEDPNNVYGQRYAPVGSYAGFGGIGPMSATADPKLMYPVSLPHGYGYPLRPLTIATGAWSAASPRFRAKEWRGMRYLGRQMNGTMTVKVIDADTEAVLASHSGATSTMGFHGIDLSAVDPSTVLRVLVEGTNATTAHDQASRFAALEIDADPLDPPVTYDLAPYVGADVGIHAGSLPSTVTLSQPTVSTGSSASPDALSLVARLAEPAVWAGEQGEEACYDIAPYIGVDAEAPASALTLKAMLHEPGVTTGGSVVVLSPVLGLLSVLHHPLVVVEGQAVGPYSLTLTAHDPPRLTLSGD